MVFICSLITHLLILQKDLAEVIPSPGAPAILNVVFTSSSTPIPTNASNSFADLPTRLGFGFPFSLDTALSNCYKTSGEVISNAPFFFM